MKDRKGDSLETLRNGNYQGMNTAVILNQSGVFQANEWKGGRHYPIFPSSHHLPVQNMLPIVGLKQLSLGKTDNTWVNLNGVYSPQIPMVQYFSPPHVTIPSVKPPMSTSVAEQKQRTNQVIPSTNAPQFRITATQSNTKTTVGQRTTQIMASTNLPQYNTFTVTPTTGQSVTSVDMPQFIPTASQINTKTTNGYQQPVIQNFGGYMIQNRAGKPINSNNLKPPSNSSVNLTELSPYKETPTIHPDMKTTQSKQRELLQTRKRSSSWPGGSGLSKKKQKDGVSKDDQIIEEYKNVEMDVARILISDIPFPVVSVGGKDCAVERSLFVRSGGGQAADRQTEMSAVVNGGIMETEKQSNGSNPWSGEMEGTGGVRVPEAHTDRSILWSGGMSEFNKQMSRVMSGEEPGKTSNGWSGVELDKEPTKSTLGSGALIEPEKQGGSSNQWRGGTPEAAEQTKLSTLVSGGITEPEKGVNNAPSGGMANSQADIFRVRSSGNHDSNKQPTLSPLRTEGVTESPKQMTTLNVWSGVIQEPNKQTNKSASTVMGLEPEKHSSGTESDASLHFENEKENYSKNLISPTKVVFTCQQCMVTFESTQDLISHTASHTSNNFTFKCNVCTQVFRSTNGLQKHIEFHADHQKNFQCSFCFKPFADRDGLEEHIIGSHMSKRPHKCSYCPKAFRDPGSLQKHIRIHTGERPYKCTACDKSFAEYSSLRKHNRVHTGEQPYKCQYCSKAFSISGNLQRHILIHTGERPYKCSECSKTFNNPSHLRRHEKNLHSKLEQEK